MDPSENDKPARRFDREIGSLRDDIAAYNFQTTHGHNRLLSLVVAKLDEAQGLAIKAGIDLGRFVLIDRAEMLRPVESDEVTTLTTGGNGHA